MNQDTDELWNQIKQVNLFWVGLSMLCGVISHLLRALRWNLLLEPMNKNGWECYFIPWDKAKMNWNYFDLAIIRSTWDYQGKINEFLKVLTDIDLSKCILQNSLNLIKWNIDKTYLETLSQKDVKIVPSLFFDKFSYDKLKKSFSHFSTDKLIIKPCISANADDTFVLKKGRYLNILPQLEHLFKTRKFITG